MSINPRLLSTYTDRATGIFAEHWQREFPLPYAPPTFWFAYPHEGANVFDGCPGDTKREAIAKVLARNPQLRKAA
jgi:hypothetical protein